MRIMSAGLAVAFMVMLGGAASAIEYPWCAEYATRGGATNCGFSTVGQCRAAISGLGGFCRENLFYTGSAADAGVVARPRHKKRARR